MIDPKNAEIRDQIHLMDAEGMEDVKPTVRDISAYIIGRGYSPYDIDIWYDHSQSIWRWYCKIIK